MEVYRVCNEEELNKIFSKKSFENIGHEFISGGLNSHDYKPNQKYMHFFPRINFIILIDTSAGNYICTYDIPEDILQQHYGFASYWDPDPYNGNENVLEYAIPSNEIKYDYLEKVDKIIKNINTSDELTDSEIYSQLVQPVYQKAPHKII